MNVKPAPGRAVRDPTTMQLLPPEGRDVPPTPFWRRRVRDGDVIPTGSNGDKPPATRRVPREAE